ncbi:MAG: S49 family peptidase [Alphaproteobacteria bacterium]|nr:S49 family peptidase [Alphaproteobacteria bacterium]
MTHCNHNKCFFTKIFTKIFGLNKTPRVATINLSGIIGKDSKLESGINFSNQAPLLKKAFETKKISAVAISINSPGGSPVQSELIYNFIRELSKKHKIPVYTFAQDVSASGGYWLLLSGDEIYAHNSSIIGSIGVIFSSFGFVDLIKKIGVERRIYTEGKNKAILDPFLPEDLDNIAILKEAQKDIFDNFKNIVSLHRATKINKSPDELFTGAFWAGSTAFKLGLIDGIADLRQKMQEKFGDDVEFIEITPRKTFIKNLISEKSLGLSGQAFEDILNKIEERISFNKFGL